MLMIEFSYFLPPSAAVAAGRDPAAIRRLYNVMGTISDGGSTGFLHRPPGQWVEELSELAPNSWVEGPSSSPRRRSRSGSCAASRRR
jgi:hypothetical protein